MIPNNSTTTLIRITSTRLLALFFLVSNQLDDKQAFLQQLLSRLHSGTLAYSALEDCLHQLVRAFEYAYNSLDALDQNYWIMHWRGVIFALITTLKWSESSPHHLVASCGGTDIRDAPRYRLCIRQTGQS